MSRGEALDLTAVPFDAPRLLPWDAENQRLVAQVHPPDWINPTPRDRYHLVVIGAGTGGLVTAAIAAALGARVALVERHLMGGDCLNFGCVPSKALLRAARAWADAVSAADYGGPAVTGSGDFAAVMARMRRLRAELAENDSATRFQALGVDVFLGEARFTGPDRLVAGAVPLRFRRAVIATGSRPAVPPIAGLAGTRFHTSETIFSLEALPRRLAVIGAGPIGCELAQAFARFGSRVTLFEFAERILPGDDEDAARLVEAALRRDGVAVGCGIGVKRLERTPQGLQLHCEQAGRPVRVAADEVLVATGRAPNVEALDLAVGGVRFTDQGVTVDARLRTSNPRVYAVGDVCSEHRFTHVADAHARLVVRNALFFGRARADRLIVPWCTYTSPEVAHVGMPAAAAAADTGVETITVPMKEVDRARLDGEDHGFLRLHLRRGSDRILGATVVAERAGDLVSQITQAMTAGLGLARLGQAIFPYPTQAEVIRRAADLYRRRALTPRARRGFGLFFRLVR